MEFFDLNRQSSVQRKPAAPSDQQGHSRDRLFSAACPGPDDIEAAVRSGKTIRLLAPILNESLSRRLEHVLHSLVLRYERPALYDCLHSCLVELATNASRANMKHVFFFDRDLDQARPEDYAVGQRAFKASREHHGWHRALSARAREMGLTLEIIFRHSENGLRIEVINSLELTPQDERRIREKLGKAMRNENIYEFFTTHGDDTEGQGLGFAMNVLFLRSENIDPSLLRIGSSEGRTVARLEVPFSQQYVTVRAREAGAIPA